MGSGVRLRAGVKVGVRLRAGVKVGVRGEAQGWG